MQSAFEFIKKREREMREAKLVEIKKREEEMKSALRADYDNLMLQYDEYRYETERQIKEM